MKIIKYFLIAIFICLPIKIGAVSIGNVTINGNSDVYATKLYSYEVKIDFNDLKKNNSDKLGLMAISYELLFDSKLFGIDEISTKGRWNSELYNDNGKYYVLNSISEYSDAGGKCDGGILYCDSYTATITFYVKDIKKNQKASIKVGNIETAFVSNTIEPEDLTIDDIKVIKKNNATVKNVSIKKNNTTSDKFTGLKEKKGKPSVNSQEIIDNTQKLTPVSNKSKNNLLAKLEVVGYEIEFSKYYNDYYIVIPEGINKLEVKYTVSDKKAKVKVIGNDDIKANNDEIQVEVTSENGDVNTYRIKIGYEEKEEKTSTKSNFLNLDINIDDKYLKIGGIVLGGLIFITLVIAIVFRIKDHKMEKKLDKL